MTKPKKPRKSFTIRQEELNLLYEVVFNLNTLILMDMYKPLSPGEVAGLYSILRRCREHAIAIGKRADPDGAQFVVRRALYGGEP